MYLVYPLLKKGDFNNNVTGSSPEGGDLVVTGPCLLPWLGQTPCGRGDAEIGSMSFGVNECQRQHDENSRVLRELQFTTALFPPSPLKMLEMH